MNASTRIIRNTAIALGVAFGSAFAASADDFGRAGGGVGADRVLTISRSAATSGAGGGDLGNWYGTAGGPVGVDAIARIANTKVTPVGNVDYTAGFGRAGGPIGVATGTPKAERVAYVK